MNDVKASGQRSSRSAAPSPNPARTELSAALPAVLLVDDQPARLLTYESILQGVGVTCERALSGREALEKLLRQSYAVILLDISMPEMDGYETARFIREHPKFERTPIIFITGVHLSELDTLKGYEAGAIDYISVPIVPEILRSKVALLVELYRRRTELEALNSELLATRERLEAERNAALVAGAAQQEAASQRAEKEWLSAVLNSMNEEVYFTDTSHRYTYANPAALREFGHDRLEDVRVENLVAGLEVLRADGTPRPLEEAPPLRALQGELVRDEEHIVRTPRTGEFRHRQVSAAPVRDRRGKIIGSVSVVRDITDRKRTEEAFRAQDMRTAALLRLADQFRSLTSPADLAFAASKILGETLNVSRCGYGTIDAGTETIAIERDWTAPGIESLAGVRRFREYGTFFDDLKRGEFMVCTDVELDPRTAAAAQQFKAINIRSFVSMPITEDGGFVALLYLNHPRVRLWLPEELAFIRDVAERTRLAVERRRSEQAAAADLKYTVLLRDLAGRLVGEGDVQKLFEEILAAAMTISAAQGGTLQLLDEASQALVFAATIGLDAELTSQFERVNASSGSPCGVALGCGERAFLDFDVPASEDPDGSRRMHFSYGLVCAQSTPLLSRSGRPLGMVSTHWRQRHRLSERELRFLDMLARQAADLIERTQANQALRVREQQLREADRRKDEFIAMLAHELRNPLVPIRAGVELLKSAQGQPGLTESVRPMMERQVSHMIRLIDDLLDVSRITSGKIELRPQPTTLSTVVGSAVEANRSAINAGNLELHVKLDRPDWVLHVDPTRFAQVLSNLLQNSAKFTPPGGWIRIDARIEERRASAELPELVVQVCDSGVGIAPEMLPRVFELFAQANTAGQRRHTGLGIGLALARRLIEMHGGTLEARSEGLGRGSEFTVRVPAPHGLEAQGVARPSDVQPLAGIRVLVIDDTRDAADSMALLLESLGGSTRVAYDGVSGLTLLERDPADIVLLDIGMPGMDGYGVCRVIRERFGARVGVVAISGWGQDQDKQMAARAGFDAHLTKPADPAGLEKVIRTLSRRRL
jgi:PAS domain S-box-containing protein